MRISAGNLDIMTSLDANSSITDTNTLPFTVSVSLLNSQTHLQSLTPPLVWTMASGYQLEGRHRETGVCGIA